MIVPRPGDVVEYCIKIDKDYTVTGEVMDVNYSMDPYSVLARLKCGDNNGVGLMIDIDCEHIDRIISYAQHTHRKTNIYRKNQVLSEKTLLDSESDSFMSCVIDVLQHMNVEIIKPLNPVRTRTLYNKNGVGLQTGAKSSIKNKKKFKRWVAVNYTQFYYNKTEWKL
ncbi:MAG: hypothetical protein GY804_08895 [Alphaproteobacteria bacterium]|nr:hypothetical protein [Alphaproteobacteria bacterium]